MNFEIEKNIPIAAHDNQYDAYDELYDFLSIMKVNQSFKASLDNKCENITEEGFNSVKNFRECIRRFGNKNNSNFVTRINKKEKFIRVWKVK